MPSRSGTGGGTVVDREALRSVLRRSFVGLLRRLALGLEAVDRSVLRRRGVDIRRGRPASVSDCELLAVVAHWRTDGPSSDAAGSTPLLDCLAGLLAMPVARLEVVVTTNDDAATAAELAPWLGARFGGEVGLVTRRWSGPATATRTITVERWSPRWPWRHGFNLTWHHKQVFRRALRADRFSHLLYLEDDIAFTADNLAYWLAARPVLADRQLLPGFVRFERVGAQRMLVDQARSGQHVAAGDPIELDGGGALELRRSLRPYQACYLLDRELAAQHFRSSAMRSPLRSRVVAWDVRERAAAGEVFAPTVDPLRAMFRSASGASGHESRHGVLLAGADQMRGGSAATPGAGPTDGGGTPVAGALIEHLRPTYSVDPSSRHGKVPVERF